MAEKWVSVREAASVLGITPRTVWRKVKSGELDSRTTAEGRREVRLEALVTPSDVSRDALSVVREQAERGLQVASTAVQIAREETERARLELRSARRAVRVALVVLVLCLAGVAVGAWFLSEDRTRQAAAIDAGDARIGVLASDLDGARGDLREVRADRQRVQGELVQAEKGRAGLAGELGQVKVDLATADAKVMSLEAEVRELKDRPTTRPTWRRWWNRLRGE